jgi:UDP-3-O-[3-hydroxymyristoyl] N-acetylglucosamine deacetylase
MKEIAPCRTFGFLKDVERMQAMGLALGGSLQNAVVLDEQKALNPDGLRFQDEFVRHKVLDAIGDFSLIGYPILGEIELHRAGHELQTKLVQELLEQPGAFSIFVPENAEAFEKPLCLRQNAYAF